MPKAPKDANAPKRNLSAYFIFTNERRAALKAQHPDKKLTALTTLMAAEWKGMAADQKKAFQDRAAAQKKEFAAAMAEYKKTESYAKHQETLSVWKAETKLTADKKAAKKPKDPNAPKRPPTAYFLFAAAIRKEVSEANPEMKITEIAKVIGQKWKETADAAKKPFQEKAAALKEAHKERVAEYRQSDDFRAFEQKMAVWQQQQDAAQMESQGGPSSDGAAVSRPKVAMARKPKDPNAPKKAVSAYLLYSNSVRDAVRAANPTMKMTEIAKLIGAQWKALSEEELRRWKGVAAQKKEEHRIAMEKYKGSEHQMAFAAKMAEWKRDCERRQKEADAKFVQKMATLSTNAKSAKKKASKKVAAAKAKKKRRFSSDSDSSSYSSDSSSSGSYSSSSSSSGGSSSSGSYSSSD